MDFLTECHYRGRTECPVRILGYYTGQRESMDELGVCFLHSERDVKKYTTDVSKLYSFDCPKVGVMAYRVKDNVLAVGINFVNVRTLLLINNGYAEVGCWDINQATAMTLEAEKVLVNNTKYYKANDASKEIKTMLPITELDISSEEANVILDTLQKFDYRVNGEPLGIIDQEQLKKETHLYDEVISYLREISKVSA